MKVPVRRFFRLLQKSADGKICSGNPDYYYNICILLR